MPFNRRRLIRLAEYAAISASVVGAIAAITTQQSLYAVVPLTITAALNLLSRQVQLPRSSQPAEQTTTAQLAQQVLLQLPPVAQIDQLSKRIEDSEQSIKIQKQSVDALSQKIDDQRTQQQSIDQQVAKIASSSQAIQSVQSTIAQQAQQIATTQASLQTQQESSQALKGQLSRRIDQLYVDFDSLREALDALALQFAAANQPPPEQADPKPEDPKPEEDISHLVPRLPDAENFDLDINLGIDFGTGYTKVCFRDVARDRSEVVTFANLDKGELSLDETLMPTRLAILEEGTLLTGLTTAEWNECEQPIKTNIDYIKMRLAAIDLDQSREQSDTQDEWRIEQIAELDDDKTVESLCAYYLSRVIERSQQWITKNHPELFENQTVRWSANLGVPVEYCDSSALERFRHVLAIAWLLNSTEVDTSSLTIEKLNRLTEHLRQWMKSNISIERLDCTTTPEIVAAMWSFINSRQAQDGFYTFFDIGDGTLDGAAFVFKRAGGDRKVDCYIGEVEPLGVSAFVEKTADELNLSADTIKHLLNDDSDVALRSKMQQSTAHKKIQQMVARVVMDGNEKHREIRGILVGKDIGDNLKVFIGGGGGNTHFFPQTIEATHGDFDQQSADIPSYDLKQIPTPDDLSTNGIDNSDFNRFAVAYGLCIPKWEGPEIKLPSQFDNIDDAAAEIETPRL